MYSTCLKHAFANTILFERCHMTPTRLEGTNIYVTVSLLKPRSDPVSSVPTLPEEMVQLTYGTVI